MEKHYELLLAIQPDVAEDSRKEIIGKISGIIEEGQGKLGEVEEWGRRELAYPIQKYGEGYYYLFKIASPPEVVKEVDRVLKLNEDVIRHIVVRVKPGEAVDKEDVPEETSTSEVAGEGGSCEE